MKTRLIAVLLLTGLILVGLLAGRIDAQSSDRLIDRLQDHHVLLPVLFTDPSPPHYPPINRIVFASDYTSSDPWTDIFTINPDGSGRTRLTDGSNVAYRYPVWSPDGGQIAFTAIASDGAGGSINHIYVMNADGSGVFNLVNLPGHHFHPTWSPYGDQIAFSSDMHNPGPDTPNDIYVINADGTGAPVNLTNSANVHESNPAWSPDGQRIAYGAYFAPDYTIIEIMAMNADGTLVANLTQSAAADYAPRWSPDSQRIVFDRDLASTSLSPGLFPSAHSSFMAILTPLPGPGWSAEGLKIPFRDLASGGLDSEIFSMNADGSGQLRLTDNSGQSFYPDWSPNGSQIIFQSYFDAYADLYIMNANGTGMVNITNSQYQYASVQPDWQ